MFSDESSCFYLEKKTMCLIHSQTRKRNSSSYRTCLKYSSPVAGGLLRSIGSLRSSAMGKTCFDRLSSDESSSLSNILNKKKRCEEDTWRKRTRQAVWLIGFLFFESKWYHIIWTEERKNKKDTTRIWTRTSTARENSPREGLEKIHRPFLCVSQWMVDKKETREFLFAFFLQFVIGIIAICFVVESK